MPENKQTVPENSDERLRIREDDLSLTPQQVHLLNYLIEDEKRSLVTLATKKAGRPRDV